MKSQQWKPLDRWSTEMVIDTGMYGDMAQRLMDEWNIRQFRYLRQLFLESDDMHSRLVLEHALWLDDRQADHA